MIYGAALNNRNLLRLAHRFELRREVKPQRLDAQMLAAADEILGRLEGLN